MGAGGHQGGHAGRCRASAGRSAREAGGRSDPYPRRLRRAERAGSEASRAARGAGRPLPGRAGGGDPAAQAAPPRLSSERWGRAGGRGGGARGGGLAPERRGVGAIKMHPMELPMEKDGTETRQREEVVKAEEDAREAAAAAAAGK